MSTSSQSHAPKLLTIFTIPKGFQGTIGLQQRNALRSWTRLGSDVEVLVCGNDPGVAEAAAEFGMRYTPEIARNERGTPLVSAAFSVARGQSTAPLLCYVNADIILTSHFLRALKSIGLPRFLMSGRRWDLDFETKVDFEIPTWEMDLVQLARTRGTLHGPEAMDYFAFPREFLRDMPPFAVGRAMWDNWLVFHARAEGGEVVDATEDAFIIHQNHGYAHTEGGQVGAYFGPEANDNRRLASELLYPFTLEDATLRLRRGKLSRPAGARALTRSAQSAVALSLRTHPRIRVGIRRALRAKGP